MDSQSPHSEAWDREPRQAFTISVRDLRRMHFSRTERVVTEHCGRQGGVYQDVDLRDPPAAVLCCKTRQVLVQDRRSAVEGGAIMNLGIESMLLKHDAPNDARSSEPPSMQDWE